jgi:hypothetical protein
MSEKENVEEVETVEEETVEEGKRYFVLTMTPALGDILGIVQENHYEAWVTQGVKLLMGEPKRLLTMPKQDDQKNIIGASFGVGEIHLLPSEQKAIILDPAIVEVLGEVVDKDGHAILQNAKRDVMGLFTSYLDMVVKWAALSSGLIAPSGDEIAATNRIKL